LDMLTDGQIILLLMAYSKVTRVYGQ
jgi:hypothetical protein